MFRQCRPQTKRTAPRLPYGMPQKDEKRRRHGEFMLYKKYTFGDTDVYYTQCKDLGAGLMLFPAGTQIEDVDALSPDCMVQAALRGARNLIDYSQGVTMRNMSSTLLSVVSQQADGKGVVTRLSDGEGNDYEHTLRYDAETGVFSVRAEYFNNSGKTQVLESLQSFSLSGIFNTEREKPGTEGLRLVRMTSAWSRECRLKEEEFSSLGFDMSWARYGVKCERFGQLGSMPNRGYFPFAAIAGGGVTWAAMLEAPYSWQIEVYKEKETCALSGGLSDYEFGHWCKEIPAGGGFKTHRAYLRVKKTENIDEVCNDFVRYQDGRLRVPESEESMPVLFNEYCTTWGTPSEENILAILESIKGLPIGTFVIDAGWYLPENCGWCNAIGDWNESKKLFPGGIGRVVSAIRAAGMKAGVWFEFENVAADSKKFGDEDCLIKRNGVPLTSKNRRFLDLRKREVQEYLQGKMLDFLADKGFEYIKIDYNDTFGIGGDGAESFGESGRQITELSLDYLARLREAVPGIVIENCSSGGSRIEPLRMHKVSMCSFSDAHESKEIPLVAANVSRVIPARQNQVWATIRKEDTVDRIVWSMTAAMFGRICISGDVHLIDSAQKAKIKEGIDFYNAVKDVVRLGRIDECFCNIKYFRDPKGCQIYKKVAPDGRRMLVLAHFFERPYERFECAVEGYKLVAAYTTLDYEIKNGALALRPAGEYQAGAFLLEREA